jgi:hypothetical protein
MARRSHAVRPVASPPPQRDPVVGTVAAIFLLRSTVSREERHLAGQYSVEHPAVWQDAENGREGADATQRAMLGASYLNDRRQTTHRRPVSYAG